MALPLPFDTQGFDVVNVLNIANWALQADPNNTPPVALLAGVTYTGIATQWGSCNRLDLVGSIDQAGTLFIDQSRDGGATWPAALTEQWAGAIGESFAFPTARAVGANAYRLRFTAGGVNLAALVLSPALTVGIVDHDKPLVVNTGAIVGVANTDVLRVIGSRYVTCTGVESDGSLWITSELLRQLDAAGNPLDMVRLSAEYGPTTSARRLVLASCAIHRITNGQGAKTMNYNLAQYP